MDSTSLIFSGGRPGKASSVASFVALTLALGTLVVAAFVLFTAFTGWNNLAVSMQLRALDPLVAKVANGNTTRRSRRKPSASPSNPWLRTSPTLYVGSRTGMIEGKVSSAITVVHTGKVRAGQRTANGTFSFLTRLFNASRSTQNLRLSTPMAHRLLGENTANTSLKAPERKDHALPGLPEVFETEESAQTYRIKETANDLPSRLSEGHVKAERNADCVSAKTDEGVRAAPVLSDGSEWPVKALTALSEDPSISGSAFFLDLDGSGPQHHNHSKHGQRPIFVPEGPAHEHKIFAGSASTSEQPSALTLTTLTTKRPLSSGTPTRQPLMVKTSSVSLTTEGSQQPTLQESHEGTVVQIRESRLTMSFHRPHRHDAANVTDLPPASEYTYATSGSAHRRHDSDVGDIRTHASSNGRDHEGHVPRLPEGSSPTGDASLSGSSVTLTMPGKSEEVQSTSSTFSFGSVASPRVHDCTTTSVLPSPVTVGETEPFNEDVETATSGGPVPSSRKHDHMKSRPSQKATGARDSHYSTTHKSHVRKLNVATLKAIVQREATIRDSGNIKSIWKRLTSSNLNRSDSSSTSRALFGRRRLTISHQIAENGDILRMSVRRLSTPANAENLTVLMNWDDD